MGKTQVYDKNGNPVANVGRQTIFDKNGKAYVKFAIDAKECIATGNYFEVAPPKEKRAPAKKKEPAPEPKEAVTEPKEAVTDGS